MKFHRKAAAFFSALAILGGVAVCDLPVTADNTVYAATVQLTISKSVISLGKGESFRLTANKSVKWRTSAPKLVTVDSKGNVKAVGIGTAWVTGKATDGKEKSCKITVKNAPSKITLSKGVVTIGVGEKFSVTSTIPNETACAKRTYRTSNSSIVRMTRTDWQGDFVGVKPGVAYVTVRSYNGKESTCKITVKNAPSKITLSKGVVTIGVGEKFSVTSTIQNETACAKRTYRTSNSSIVKMTRTDWQGDFVGVKPGVAYVTVRSYNGKESTCKVTVRKAPTWVSISKKNLTMTVGQSATLSAGIASDAGCASRTFRTSNSSIVKMTKTNWTGSFTAVKPGTAWVTVRTYNGKESSCKVTVKAKATSNITYIDVIGNAVIDKNKTTGSGSVRIYSDSKNVDLSTFKVTLKNNTDNIVSYTKYIANEQYYDGEVDLGVLFTAKTANRTKDYIVTAVITCGNKSEEMSIIVECEKDESVKAYYAPFDIDQIVKDMRKYGESHGMTWKDSKYVKFNDKTDPAHQNPITNSSFCIPVDTRVTGLTLKQQLLDSVLWPYEENKVYDPYLKLEEMHFKVVPLYNSYRDYWEFYVLY